MNDVEKRFLKMTCVKDPKNQMPFTCAPLLLPFMYAGLVRSILGRWCKGHMVVPTLP